MSKRIVSHPVSKQYLRLNLMLPSHGSPQQAQKIDWPKEAKQDRRFPLLDQILTSPSSPAVNSVAPS
eukprot:gene27339-34042_t